jgi:D-alanine-D-alanine ligase
LEVVSDGFFDYAAKYGGGTVFLVPAPIDPAARKAVEDAAVAMYDALGCRGVARVDFFLTEAGPVLNEVNTTPGFTEHSQVPRMYAAAGLSYSDLLSALISDALG